MALRVWLPLNGNLDNQGLSNARFTTATATIDNNGKIGKCYSFTATTGIGIYLNAGISVANFMSTYINNHSWTLCAWIITTSTKTTPVFGLTYGLRFWCGASTIIGLYNSSRNIQCNANTATNDGKWHHITASYDVITNKISIYVDGILKNTVNYTSGYTYESSWTNGISIGRDLNNSVANDSYFFNGKVNDIRIYDHCLSPKEVKEISKGLVIHYKLDDPYIETTINLADSSTNYHTVNEGQEYACSGWGGDAGTVRYYKSGGYNNGPYKVYHKTATGSGGIYKKLEHDIHIISGKTYTMSVYVKASRAFTDSAHSFNINRNAATQYSASNRYITCNRNIQFTTEWQRVTRTFTATDADAGDYGEMSILYNDGEVDYYVYYSCFQIEENDHATNYINGSINVENTTNLLDYSNLAGHGSSWVLQDNTFDGTPIYRNVVTTPNTGNNAGFRIISPINNSGLSTATKVTLSFYKKLNTVYGVNLGGYLRVVKSDDTEGTYSWSYNKVNWANDANSIGIWDFIKATVTIPTGCKQIKYMYVYVDRATGGSCDFAKIQLELKDHVTPYVNGTRSGNFISIYDCSGYKYNGIINGPLLPSIDTLRYKYSTRFNGNDSCITIPYKQANPDGIFTVNLWFKKDGIGSKNYESLFGGPSGFEMDTRAGGSTTLSLYMASIRGGNVFSPFNLNQWYMVTMTRDGTNELYYINGELKKTIEAKSMPNGTYYIGAWSTIDKQNYYGNISDFRIYATALSAEDIKELYDTSAIVDNQGDLMCLEYEEKYGNILFEQNIGILNKQWIPGLSKFEQTHCKCTLTDIGYRIYRTPNLTYPADGTVMWGGFVLDNTNNRFNLKDNHTYIIEFDIKGQSSNATDNTNWSNYVGWSGGGLIPAPTNVIQNNPVKANFNSSEWLHYFYKFTISDGLYKVCTNTYASYTAGETYLSYKGFKFGFAYQNTGELGTDLYIKNICMFDITENINIDIFRTGIVKSPRIIEENTEVRFFSSGLINADQLLEI